MSKKRNPVRGQRRKSQIRTLLGRDGENCWICGGWMPPHDRTRDHVIPIANGGTNDLGNLRLAHGRCNFDRGAAEDCTLVRLEGELAARQDAVGELFRRVARDEIAYVARQLADGQPTRWDRPIPPWRTANEHDTTTLPSTTNAEGS